MHGYTYTAAKNKFTVAQASRNSASPNTEETDKKKKAKRPPTCTNSKRPRDSDPAPAQLCAASSTIAKKKHENLSTGTNSKRQKLFNDVNFDIPGEDQRKGTDGWWRRCRRTYNNHGSITTEWCFWHVSMKLKSIRSVKQARIHGKKIGFPFIGSQRSDKPINMAQHFIHAQQIRIHA